MESSVETCSVEGCARPRRTRKAVVCNVHYHRLWRTGKLEQVPKQVIEHSCGYLLDRVLGHALSTPGNPSYVYQHRRIFYENHGNGPFACHVCGASVTWSGMHVDHLDDDPRNNVPDNLAPACPTCNRSRGRAKMAAARRAQGRLFTLNGETRCLSEWAGTLGISAQSLRHRIAAGWPIERALSDRASQGKRPARFG